jgi:hypothetical protein
MFRKDMHTILLEKTYILLIAIRKLGYVTKVNSNETVANRRLYIEWHWGVFQFLICNYVLLAGFLFMTELPVVCKSIFTS